MHCEHVSPCLFVQFIITHLCFLGQRSQDWQWTYQDRNTEMEERDEKEFHNEPLL